MIGVYSHWFRCVSFITAVFFSHVYTMGENRKNNSSYSKTLSLANSLVIGSVAGMTEVLVDQPLIYCKNMLQQGQKISLDPRVLYRGFGVNISCMVPTTALQIAANSALEDIIPGIDTSTMMLRAFGAGALSALTSTPTELIVLQQQNAGTSTRVTIQNFIEQQGYGVLYRGVSPKALRDGVFCVGYLSLYPVLKNEIRATYIDSDPMAMLIAGMSAGVVTAVASHPFDTVATLMQADYARKQNVTMLQTASALYRQNGAKGFFKGVVPRGTRVAMAIPLMNEVQQRLTDVIAYKE